MMWTDGSCKGNPGRGGFGCMLVYRGVIKEVAGGYRLTTNNRMELMAVVMGLRAVKGEGWLVEVVTDSVYVESVVRGVGMGRVYEKNGDIVGMLRREMGRLKVGVVRVKGHSGIKENERVDGVARRAMTRGPWLVDEGYKKTRGVSTGVRRGK